MGFGDYETAIKARDVHARLVEKVVNRLRPEPRQAEVYDFDTASMTCDVLLPGDTTPLKVKMGRGQVPLHRMMDSPDGSAQGDLIRIAGKAGNYYILSVYGSDQPAGLPAGVIQMWPSTTPPLGGWLLCNGQSTAGYPALAAVVGPNVPDIKNRILIGAGTKAAVGATENATEAQRATRFDHRHFHSGPSHSHTQADHTHSQGTLATNLNVVSNAPTGGTTAKVTGPADGAISGATGAGTNPQTAASGTAATSTEGLGGFGGGIAEHPFYTVNFIIKT